MLRSTTAVASLIAAGVLLPASATAGSTSHVSLWQNKKGSVECGIEASALSKKKILCSAHGIPRPPHTNPNVGDPFVELAGTGKPKLVLISQDSFPSGAKTHALANGTVWSNRGVTCTLGRKTVTCKNGAHHGFTIGNGHYKSF